MTGPFRLALLDQRLRELNLAWRPIHVKRGFADSCNVIGHSCLFFSDSHDKVCYLAIRLGAWSAKKSAKFALKIAQNCEIWRQHRHVS